MRYVTTKMEADQFYQINAEDELRAEYALNVAAIRNDYANVKFHHMLL